MPPPEIVPRAPAYRLHMTQNLSFSLPMPRLLEWASMAFPSEGIEALSRPRSVVNAASFDLARDQGRAPLPELVSWVAPAVYDTARFFMGPSEGPDVAQDALLKIVTRFSQFDYKRGNFRSWALEVTRNVAKDRLRRLGREQKVFRSQDTDDPAEIYDRQLQTNSNNPQVLTEVRQQAALVRAALEAMPTGMTAALVMSAVHELTYQEIAETLEVPLGTVMTWIHRGRHRVKAILESNQNTQSAEAGGQQ